MANIYNFNNGDEFEIDCMENSFGKFLGFTEMKYENSSKYISETPSSLLSDAIYLYFPNISNELPFCKINLNNNIEYFYNDKLNIDDIDCLIVQIKDIKTDKESNFHDFNNNKFLFELTFDCIID